MEENINKNGTPVTEDAANGNRQGAVPPMRHHRRAANDKYFKIRNTLNIIFIIGAIAGMATFYFHDRTIGTLVIITAMAFKIAECCFRFIRQ